MEPIITINFCEGIVTIEAEDKEKLLSCIVTFLSPLYRGRLTHINAHTNFHNKIFKPTTNIHSSKKAFTLDQDNKTS